MLLLRTRWQGHCTLARHAVAACIAHASPATSAWHTSPYSTKPPAEQLDQLVDAIIEAANKRRNNTRAKAIDVASIVDAVLAPAATLVANKPIQRVDHLFTEPSTELERVPRHMQHSLKAALVGAPNAGKSTLTNKLTGCKVSAVSHKTNTTVETTLGSFTTGMTQVVLFDTPGLVTKQHYLNHKHGARIRSAWATATTCNLVIFMVDAARQVIKPDPRVLRLVENISTLGTGAGKTKRQHQLLPDPSVATTAGAAAHDNNVIDVHGRSGSVHGEQLGQQMGEAASDPALTGQTSSLTEAHVKADAMEAELEAMLTDGQTFDQGNIDRAGLTRALENLLDVEQNPEEDHEDDKEDAVHVHSAAAASPDASLNLPATHDTHTNDALTLTVVPTPPGSPRVPTMTMKNLSDLQLLSENHSGQQLTDILRQRREASLAERPPQTGTLAQEQCPPCILVMNKMDLLSRREKLLALRWANEMIKLHQFEDVFYISAEKNKGLRELREFLLARAERGEWLLAEGQATDANPAELVQELVREAVYTHLHQELPYTTEVVHIKWEFQQGGSARCVQHILVKNKRQHAMVVGHRGAVIDRITRGARKEAEKVLGIPLDLRLSVKVLQEHLRSEHHVQRVADGHVGW